MSHKNELCENAPWPAVRQLQTDLHNGNNVHIVVDIPRLRCMCGVYAGVPISCKELLDGLICGSISLAVYTEALKRLDLLEKVIPHLKPIA